MEGTASPPRPRRPSRAPWLDGRVHSACRHPASRRGSGRPGRHHTARRFHRREGIQCPRGHGQRRLRRWRDRLRDESITMAYKKYTTCIEPEHYVIDLGTRLFGYVQLIFFVLSVGFVAYAIIAIAGGPAAIIAALAFLAVWISVLLWYLHGRLICLGDDPRNCAIIGMVKSHSPSDPSWGKKYGDDDY